MCAAALRMNGRSMPAMDIMIESAVRYLKIISLVSITAFLFIRYKYHKVLFRFYVLGVKFVLQVLFIL